MTKDKLERLGERAIACAGWRWVEGMMTTEDQMVVYVSPRQEEGAVFVDLYAGCDIPREVDLDGPEDVIPNLVHPTTSGAMLALVRAAWKDDTLAATYHEGEDDGVAGGWDITAGDFSVLGVQVSTEAEALLLALESAPGSWP